MKWIDSYRGRPLLEYAASGILGARLERTEPRRTWLRVFVRLGGCARWENGSKKIEPREQCAPVRAWHGRTQNQTGGHAAIFKKL
jgi:hypothetical protein